MFETQIATSSLWAEAHLNAIAPAFAASLFVVYGDTLAGVVKRAVRSQPWPLRIAAFVVLCAFGVPLILTMLTPLIKAVLLCFGPFWVMPSTVTAFVLVGIAAERRHLI